jgi:hypothetical protein
MKICLQVYAYFLTIFFVVAPSSFSITNRYMPEAYSALTIISVGFIKSTLVPFAGLHVAGYNQLRSFASL